MTKMLTKIQKKLNAGEALDNEEIKHLHEVSDTEEAVSPELEDAYQAWIKSRKQGV